MAVNAPVVIDLFSGAGGLSLGFRAAGCRILAGIDQDDAATPPSWRISRGSSRTTLPSCRRPTRANCTDFDLDGIPGDRAVDIVIGGPPCQGFSRIGRAKLDSLRDEGFREEGFEEDPRNELYKIFLSAVRPWKPRAFVMENVPGMLSLGGQNVAEDIGGDLAESGYRVGYAVLNAVWYGVPQFRERLFFIGIRDDLAAARPCRPRPTGRRRCPRAISPPPSSPGRPSGRATCRSSSTYDLRVDHERARLPATSAFEALDDLPQAGGPFEQGAPAAGRFQAAARATAAQPHSSYARLMRSWPGLGAAGGSGRSRHPANHAGTTRPSVGWSRATAIRRPSPSPPTGCTRNSRQRIGDAGGDGRRRGAAESPPRVRARSRQEHALQGMVAGAGGLRQGIFPPYPEDKFVDKWRKLVPREPSWTVTAHLGKDSYSHIHYDGTQKRAISVREAARLQSFPDAFLFTGNMGDCYRQIGNAVPPLMAWSIAAAVMQSLGLPTSLTAEPCDRSGISLPIIPSIGNLP